MTLKVIQAQMWLFSHHHNAQSDEMPLCYFSAAMTTIVVSIREISQWHESWFVVTFCHQRCLLYQTCWRRNGVTAKVRHLRPAVYGNVFLWMLTVQMSVPHFTPNCVGLSSTLSICDAAQRGTGAVCHQRLPPACATGQGDLCAAAANRRSAVHRQPALCFHPAAVWGAGAPLR